MGKGTRFSLLSILGLAALIGCAAPAPAPAATPTSPPMAVTTPTQAGPTPTKAPTATPTKRPVTKASVAFSQLSLANTAVWTARGKGFFLEEGLDVDWVVAGSGAKATAAVVGRSVDVGMAAAADIISAIAQAQPMQAFAMLTTGVAFDIVMRPDVAASKGVTEKSSLEEKVKALKGLKVGASSPGSGSDFAVRYLLEKYNIDPERDLEITYIGLASLLPALKQGAIDVMAQSQPDASVAEVEGFGKIIISFPRGDVAETKDNLNIVATSQRDTIGSRREVLEAFVRATWRGMRLIKENRDEAREVVFKTTFSDMDPTVFRSAFDIMYASWPASPDATEKGFRSTLDYRQKTEPEGPPLQVKFEDFYTPKIVEAAKKQLGY